MPQIQAFFTRICAAVQRQNVGSVKDRNDVRRLMVCMTGYRVRKGTVRGMNCCRCGKNFDYEKHNGICPKCAAYNRPQGQTPYDYDVEKDISAHYEEMDESHARLHRMYDSAPAHQPEKQHEQYHRQYDNNYRHPQQPNYRTNQPNPAQGAGGVPNYRMNQPNPAQNQSGIPNNRVYQMQGQGGAPNGGTYQMQGANGNPPQNKPRQSIVGKVILIIVIINIIASFLQIIFFT